MQLPENFINKMKNILGAEINDFIESLNNPPVKAVTVNFNKLNKQTFENVADFEIKPIEMVSNGYYVQNLKFGNHLLNHLGIIYSQEPSAMYPVEMLGIKENDLVLDMCASPGGKSIQILEKLNNTGLCVSNEIVYNRCKILYENINRMSFANSIITCNSPEDFENLDVKFDKILIDAPCGGEGMFRKNNFDFNAYKQINPDTNAKRQLSILNSCKSLLKNGGRLAYSTCTYDTTENECVIEKFLQDNKDFKLIDMKEFSKVTTLGVSEKSDIASKTYRRYPHLHTGEGQFMAILEKVGDTDNSYLSDKFSAVNFSEISRKDKNTLNDFFKNIADISSLQIFKKNDSFFAIPQTLIDLENLNVLNAGCLIGTINKNIFKISHNFYKVYSHLFFNHIELDSTQATNYIKGLEIDSPHENCICVVTHLGVALGGGKVTNNKIKNYYPKELRIN